jgi:hypothetical protein
MKFWEQHEQSMRKAKLLQAAAVIFSRQGNRFQARGYANAVEDALLLEKEMEEQLNESS